MTECFNPEFKEQLPDLVAESLDAQSRSRVMEHVETCAACTQEHEILRAVHTAQMPIPFINVAKIVRALPPAPVPVRAELPWYRRAALPMAAAFLLVAGGLISVRQAGDRVDARAGKVAVAPTESVAPQSGSTAAAESADPSAASPAPRIVAASPAKTDIALVAGLDELTTDELSSLLKDVDNLAAVPVAEPEQFSPVTSVSDSKGDG